MVIHHGRVRKASPYCKQIQSYTGCAFQVVLVVRFAGDFGKASSEKNVNCQSNLVSQYRVYITLTPLRPTIFFQQKCLFHQKMLVSIG